MSAIDTDRFRERLLDERRRVEAAIHYLREEHPGSLEAEIDDALGRIESGTFGTCRTCGQPIAPERLEAMPWATQCIDCKRKAERG